MRISSKVQFINEDVKKAFERLKKARNGEKSLYEWLVRAFNDIEKNAFCGIQIPKKQIPKRYLQKFGIKNVWKYNLPNAWRLLYSIKGGEILVISIVLEWLDHKSYERRFRY